MTNELTSSTAFSFLPRIHNLARLNAVCSGGLNAVPACRLLWLGARVSRVEARFFCIALIRTIYRWPCQLHPSFYFLFSDHIAIVNSNLAPRFCTSFTGVDGPHVVRQESKTLTSSRHDIRPPSSPPPCPERLRVASSAFQSTS